MSTRFRIHARFRRGLEPIRRGAVRVEGDVVRIGKRRIPLSDIEHAEYVQGTPDEEGHVVLHSSRRATKIYTSAFEAGRLLRALGTESNANAGRVEVATSLESNSGRAMLLSIATGIGVGLAAFALHLPPLLFVAVVFIVAPLLVFRTATIDIGADGMLYRTWLDQRFVPWSEVTDIEATATGMFVKLRKGSLWVPVTLKDRGSKDEIDDLVVRARSMWWRTPDKHAQVEDLLARGDRSHEEWLRGLSNREGDFRSAPIRDEDLWTVLEDPRARQTARAAAAALLVRAGGEAERFRVAAESCASPKVRVVLEAAANGEEPDAIEKALDEVSDA